MTQRRILLIEPEDARIENLSGAIEAHPDFLLAAETDSGQVAVELASVHQPHIILVNLALKDIAVDDFIQQIRRILSEVHIVFNTPISYSISLGLNLSGSAPRLDRLALTRQVRDGHLDRENIMDYPGSELSALLNKLSALSAGDTLPEPSPETTSDQELDDQISETGEVSDIDKEEEIEIIFGDAAPEPEAPAPPQKSSQELHPVSPMDRGDEAELLPPTKPDEATPEPAIPFEGSITQEIPVLNLRPVQFSAYYPRDVLPNARYGIVVYAHIAAALDAIEKDVSKFSQELGGAIQPPKTAKQTPLLGDDIPITIMPESDELTFEPPSLTKTWRGDWTRYYFDFVPERKYADETVFVRVSIQVSGVEIAYIKLAIDVQSSSRVDLPTIIEVDNPLARAKLSTRTAEYYNKIFISYSRRDTVVAEGYRLAQMAAGHDVFMDSYSIRSGEDWRAALANAIDEADIFQLFWSEHSAGSDNCRDEWEYALLHKCPEDKCVHFIRPVYWQKPLVSPPEELGHINFRYVPFAAES